MQKPEPTLHDHCKSIMDVVHDAAARRLYLALEEVTESRVKPLEAENARLLALLAKHGVAA